MIVLIYFAIKLSDLINFILLILFYKHFFLEKR